VRCVAVRRHVAPHGNATGVNEPLFFLLHLNSVSWYKDLTSKAKAKMFKAKDL